MEKDEQEYRQTLDYIRVITPNGPVELSQRQKDLAVELRKLMGQKGHIVFLKPRRYNCQGTLLEQIRQFKKL